MPNVTVLGAGGSTVTVPFVSAANATAAQTALNIINLAVQVGLLNQANYTGSGTIPAPSGSAPLTGMIATGSVSGNAGALPFGAIDFVTNSTGKVTVVGPTNVITVASGIGGMVFGNQSVGAKIFVGQGNSAYIGFNGASAEIGLDGTGNTIWDFGSNTATTVKSYDQSATAIVRGSADLFTSSLQGGNGSVSVVAQAGTSTFVQLLGPNALFGTASAITISGAAGANISYEGRFGTQAFINPTSGNVTIQGKGGAVTLAGGGNAASFTGSATVFAGTGVFVGGLGGKNILATDTVAGVTTLISAGDGDILFNNAAGNLLRANGMGAQTLVGATSATVGGALFQTGNAGNFSTVFGNAGGANSFYLGNGITNITGAVGGPSNAHDCATSNGITNITGAVGVASLPGLHASANFYSTIAPGGFATINDFISGLDKFSLTYSFLAPTINGSGIVATTINGFASTKVTLTDNTSITFYQATVKTSDFS